MCIRDRASPAWFASSASATEAIDASCTCFTAAPWTWTVSYTHLDVYKRQTISRAAYGIGTKFPAALVGDEVKLTIELEIIKQEVKP